MNEKVTTKRIKKSDVVYSNKEINVEVEFYDNSKGKLESAVGFNGKKSYCRNRASIIVTKERDSEDMKVKVNEELLDCMVYGYTVKDNVIVVRSLV